MKTYSIHIACYHRIIEVTTYTGAWGRSFYLHSEVTDSPILTCTCCSAFF